MTKKSVINGIDQPDFIAEITLSDLFENTKKQYPQKTALIFNDTALSYQSLDEKSTAVANYLYSKGIGPGSNMGVWLNRGLDLHICILGIIKCGAAYIPFDKEMPAGRVLAVLNEIKADGCFIEPQEKKNNTNLVDSLLPGVTTFFPCVMDSECSLPAGKKYQSPSPNNIAYIIYTSGSTGQPKGIPIQHKQICHFVRAENSILNIRSTDIVYQGFSVSFDMWLEETWISYLVGATLVISDTITSKSFDSLHLFLNEYQVTVLHAVPSLLALLSKAIPTLRLINSGGEACSTNVQKKWCGDVELYNSYGPTETTVSASISRLALQDVITIGIPLPNYGMAIVDEALNPVELGEKGELVISGPGLSEGYINRDDLTTQKFLSIPEVLKELRGDRIYLTGDAGSMDEMGRIHLSGRKDDQVKLRGYRIELGEIEATINKLKGISQSVVTLKQLNGVESLVAYTIAENNSYSEEPELEENFLRKQIGLSLPPYMIPSRIIFLKEFPRLASGKVDKKLLPDFPGMEKTIGDEILSPSDYGKTVTQKMSFILRRLFPDEEVTMEKDFFDDLGGHSLLAALFVSELRENAGVDDVSIKDVYTNRPLSQLLLYWESTAAADAHEPEKQESKKVSNLSYYSCWFAQSIALVFVYGLLAAQIFIPYLGYYYLQQKWNTHLVPILVALLLFCLVPIVQTMISLTFKWLVIGKMKEGDYPLWGSYYFRWWFSRRVVELVPLELISGTPLFNKFLSLLGASVAKDAQLSFFRSGAEDLLSIGENVTISSNSVLNNAFVEGGYLKLRKIEILANGYVGTGAVVNGNCKIEQWGELNDLSSLQLNETIERGNVWEGSPAKPVRVKSAAETVTQNKISNFTIRKYKFIFTALFLVFPFAVLLPLIPTILTLNYLDDHAEDYNFNYLIYTPLLSIAYLAIFLAIVVILSRLLQHKVRPGKFPVYSLFYVKKWLADQLLALSLTVLHPIFASVFVAYFFRLLGAKVGKNTEISTASNVTHKLFEIGNESFIADAVILGETDIRNHEIILDHTSVGNKTFVGNSSLVPQGCQLGDNMLIAVLSVPPTIEQQETVTTRDWLGSPAIALPKRQESIGFPASLTFAPSLLRKFSRGFIELIRIVFPETAILCLCILFIAYGHDLLLEYSILEIILLFPLYYLGIVAIPAFLATVILKWIVVGKYKEEQLPMWTLKVWLSEGITCVYEALSVPFFLDYLRGTPWLPLLLRFYGVKTGSKVWLDTTDITEFDMVTIGSNTAINREAGPQTHLFEDRIMKIGPVFIGEGCSIGSRSIILYNSHIGNNTEIEPLSLVMKGESLPANTRWAGSPVRKMTVQTGGEVIESNIINNTELFTDQQALVY